jgi:hypothetical protein
VTNEEYARRVMRILERTAKRWRPTCSYDEADGKWQHRRMRWKLERIDRLPKRWRELTAAASIPRAYGSWRAIAHNAALCLRGLDRWEDDGGR